MVPPVAMTSTWGRLRLWTQKFDEESPFFPYVSWEIPWFPVGFSQSLKSTYWLRSWESHGSQGQKVKLIPHVEKQDQPSNWNKAKQQSRSDHPRLLEGLENQIDVWHGIPSGYGFMVFTPPGKLSLTWKPPQIASSNQTFIFYPFCWSSMFVWQIIIRIWSLLATCPHTRVLTHADLELQRLWTKDKVSHAALSLKKNWKVPALVLRFFYQLISVDQWCLLQSLIVIWLVAKTHPQKKSVISTNHQYGWNRIHVWTSNQYLLEWYTTYIRGA